MDELKNAWETYLRDGNDGALLEAIREYGQPLPADCDYPYAHRIRDIKIGEEFYRVVRLANETEPVYIYSCNTPSLEDLGVPYWLKGEQLQRWIRLVNELEADDDTDENFQLDARIDWDIFR